MFVHLTVAVVAVVGVGAVVVDSRGTWNQEDLESVREVYAETDSLKHKELAQWGDDHQQEPHSSPVTPGENLMCSVSA